MKWQWSQLFEANTKGKGISFEPSIPDTSNGSTQGKIALQIEKHQNIFLPFPYMLGKEQKIMNNNERKSKVTKEREKCRKEERKK